MRRQVVWALLAASFTLMPAAMADALADAVADYRAGEYRQAFSQLQKIHGAEPMNIRATYYLAITEAQLGKYEQARGHYGEVLTLAPQSPEADMAAQGIAALPNGNQLDAPPQFSRTEKAPRKTDKAKPASNEGGGMTAQQVQQMQQAQQQQFGNGMSPQDLMAMQMMMGGGNNNGMGNMGGMGNGGMDPMAMWMMMGQQQDPNNPQGGYGQMDPNVMSTMMMNQMLNNFSFDSNNNNNR